MTIGDLQQQLELGLSFGWVKPDDNIYLVIRKDDISLTQEIVTVTNIALSKVTINPAAIIPVHDAQLIFTER
ncbi:MAG: hypothetical protein FD122_1352 [Stygiobacter sp.]|nr:MAG: hypothetical protein FD122_1352 [Stygiobacter sp.]KAF0218003.1 MAG: hypothetical protein FD178_237 [Ignavibacteria bacterium]